jgi:putative transposase
MVRHIASQVHEFPGGDQGTVSRTTLDRWIRDYRALGLEGLKPSPRRDAGFIRRHPELFDEAAALRQEQPLRSAAQIAEILRARHGVEINERTLRDQLRRRGLTRAALEARPHVFGRFQASRPNEIWVGDVLVGPQVPYPPAKTSRPARLFAFLDDYSRMLLHGNWVFDENTRAGQLVLRSTIERWGLPENLHLDNGAPFSNANLDRTCAVLGIHLIHSRPGRPQGRGKVERIFRLVRERFLLEAEQAGIPDLETLNERFQAWVAEYLNLRLHSETQEQPLHRFLAAHTPPPPLDPDRLQDAFRWSTFRKAAKKTATLSFEGNSYQIDPSLAGRRVELRFDPSDLSELAVYCDGAPAGVATPMEISRHVHPAVPQAQPPPLAQPTGVDYLRTVVTAHDQHLLEKMQISFRQLPQEPEEDRREQPS